jgi:hypothetical protein
MEHFPSEHLDPELDAILRATRPSPDPSWVDATEQRLACSQRSWFVWHTTPALRLGAVTGFALAVAVIMLSLLGASPLGDSDQDVKAGEACRLVEVDRIERVPSIVESTSGEPQVIYRKERVRRFVERCD